jgi:hypothetical protein
MMLLATSDVLRRASNKELVERDIKVVGNYVRGDLFTRTIFVFDNKQLDEGGPLHKDYLKNCQSLLANGTLTDLNDDVVVQYMNIVWARMTKEGQYKAWLSRKRSNAYQALQNSFQSELFLCLAATCLPVCMSLQRQLTTCLFVFMVQGCARNVMP